MIHEARRRQRDLRIQIKSIKLTTPIEPETALVGSGTKFALTE
jgi:hypothetical protein